MCGVSLIRFTPMKRRMSCGAAGLTSILAPGRFLDAQTLAAGERTLTARYFLICTGAHPVRPDLAGLDEVPFLTYETIFDLDELPRRMIVVGGGPIGCEMAQAFQRLGAQVILVAERLLPKEEPEVSQTLRTVLRAGGHAVYPRPGAGREPAARNHPRGK
jgi:pyruvate/2-oxoglutarate dehydrogenase complex dihydrolipoamide dehydrogenase (E3) component